MALPEDNVKVVVGADPAANTEFSITVPAFEWWELLAVSVALVQGITDTPLPRLRITDGANTLLVSHGSTAAQAVSTTCQYTWAAGGGAPSGQVGATTAVSSQGGLPRGLKLPPGSVISSLTAGLGANSNYGAPVAIVIKRP